MELKQIIASIVAVAITALIVYRTVPWGRMPWGRKPKTIEKSGTDSKKPG